MQAFHADISNLRSHAQQLRNAATTAAGFVRDPVRYERRVHAAATAALCRPTGMAARSGLAKAAREYAALRSRAEAATARLITAHVARVCAAGTAVSKTTRMHGLHASVALVLAERAAAAVAACAADAEAAACARVRGSVHALNRVERCMKRATHAAERDVGVRHCIAAARAHKDAFLRTQSVCKRVEHAALASGEAVGRGGAVAAVVAAAAASVRCRDAFTRHSAGALVEQLERESEAGGSEGGCGLSDEGSSAAAEKDGNVCESCATPPALV